MTTANQHETGELPLNGASQIRLVYTDLTETLVPFSALAALELDDVQTHVSFLPGVQAEPRIDRQQVPDRTRLVLRYDSGLFTTTHAGAIYMRVCDGVQQREALLRSIAQIHIMSEHGEEEVFYPLYSEDLYGHNRYQQAYIDQENLIITIGY